MQENRQHGVPVDTAKFDSVQRHLRENLAAFFRLLKDLSAHKNRLSNSNLTASPTPDRVERPSSQIAAASVPPPSAAEQNGTTDTKKSEVASLVKQLIDITFVKLIQTITAPVLDEELFVEYLRSIGTTMREVANVVDEEQAKKLVDITKSLMQKGLQYRQGAKVEQRNELIAALKHLIAVLKECTEVGN